MSQDSAIYEKTVLVRGAPTPIRCVDVAGHTLRLSGTFLRIAAIEDEWFDEMDNPDPVMAGLSRESGALADVLIFWNPLPESTPRHALPHELVDIAVLPLESYENWWNQRIKSRTRNLIRKAEKQGLVVRETKFDDAFVRGMAEIFNEQPIRQGRPFWHYGKSVDTIRQQFSRFVDRETMIGAYVDDRMIGFIMLGSRQRCAHLGQILSKVSERDRNPNNALMAKAVEISVEKGHQFLVYGFWGDTSLAEFKRRCGFEPMQVPRYVVPLTTRGRIAVRFGLHEGLKGLLPVWLQNRLRELRARAYGLRGT